MLNTLPRLILAAGLALAAAAAFAADALPAAADLPAPGALAGRVACADNPEQTYALYLPSAYTPDRAWPIVYCFDPGARGRRAVEHFREAAERTGMIVAGSNNSRNGAWPVMTAAAEAMLRDTHRRLRLDDRRLYAAGMSGGARAACVVAEARRFAGVVACGGGFADGTTPPAVPFAFFASAGRDDFNYGELQDIDATLAARGTPHRLVVFDGGHDWPPPAVSLDALEWLELQAMRSGRAPRDDAFIAGLYRRRLQDLAAAPSEGEAFLGYTATVADFNGLLDTGEAAARAAALKESKAVRQYLKAERKARQQEEAWRERLRDAIAEVRHPRPRPNPGEISRQLRRQAGQDDPIGSDPSLAEPEPGIGSRPRSWLQSEDDWPPPPDTGTDRLAPLRTAVRPAQRQAAKSVGARRALAAAFVSLFEEGRGLIDSGQAAAAAEDLEMAAIVRPEAPVVEFELARAAALGGDRTAAREHLRAALAKGYRDDPRIEQLQADLGPETPHRSSP